MAEYYIHTPENNTPMYGVVLSKPILYLASSITCAIVCVCVVSIHAPAASSRGHQGKQTNASKLCLPVATSHHGHHGHHGQSYCKYNKSDRNNSNSFTQVPSPNAPLAPCVHGCCGEYSTRAPRERREETSSSQSVSRQPRQQRDCQQQYGPLSLTSASSMVLQPLMAALAALRDGAPFSASSILYSVSDSSLFPSCGNVLTC